MLMNIHDLIRYQFEPNRINETVALQVLLKALVNMPNPDFSLLKSVLPAELVCSGTSDKGHSEYRTPLYKGYLLIHQPI